MNDLATSVIRTVVPIIVGWVLAMTAKWGFSIDEANLTATLTAVFSSIYYTIIRWWETKNPKAGVLLGKAKTPTYEI